MIGKLALGFLTFSINLRTLKIISSFRKQRELHKGCTSPTLEADQYQWCETELNIPAQKIRNSIENYMYSLPLRYLHGARHLNIDKVFDSLREDQRKIAIYSDYPVKEKLKALKLKADALFCSTDEGIQQLKPSGNAVKRICRQLGIPESETLLIGDRDDTDGQSARLAGVPFLKVDIQQARKGKFYANMLQMIKTSHG